MTTSPPSNQPGIRQLIVLPESENRIVRYRVGERAFERASPIPAKLIEDVTRCFQALIASSDSSSASTSATAMTRLGQALFELLLGDEQTWSTLLGTAFDMAKPIADKVHVRIVSRDPFWVHLPWRLTQWQRWPLVRQGWRFHVSSAEQPSVSTSTRAPSRVLVLAPKRAHPIRELSSDIHHQEHADAIREALSRLWSLPETDTRIRVAHTHEELETLLREHKPHLLYVYTRTRTRGRELALVLDEYMSSGPHLVTLADFAQLIGQAGELPRMVYFNTGGEDQDHSLARPGDSMPLAELEIPLVVWRTRQARTHETASVALEWLISWLRSDCGGPLDALHDYAHSANADVRLEALTLAIRADCHDSWHTDINPPPLREEAPLLLMDRDKAKGQMHKHVLDLAESNQQRVMAAVAYAPPGNRIHELSKQLLAYIRGRGGNQALVERKKLQLPLLFQQEYEGARGDRRERLCAELIRELRAQLGADSHESLYNLLQRHAPSTRGRAMRVLWLDWGTCGDGRGQPGLFDYHLDAWIHMVAEHLTRACGDNMRVVSFIALQTEHTYAVREVMADLLDQLSGEPRYTQDTIEIGPVDKLEILKYLRGHTDCPATMHSELASYLLAITSRDNHGASNFDAIVDRLEHASRALSWSALRDRLRGELGIVPQDEKKDRRL